MPNSAAYARFVAVTASAPAAMKAALSCAKRATADASYIVTFAPRSAVFACELRASIVPVMAMPMLPPMLRIRLKRLVALPIVSRGIASIATIVSGTNSIDMPMPCMSCGQKTSQ